MGKILLVTKIGKNYGALLQAYALKTVLQNKGQEVTVLNYELKPTMETYRVFPKIKGFRSAINIIKSLPRAKATKKSVNRFMQFKQDNLNLSKPYKNYEELAKSPPDADLYITGSDQVWNPKINFDKAYYLLFGRQDVTRASYAASIGISAIPDTIKQEFTKRIANVKYKSVREKEGQKLLQANGIEATVNVDPTLLLCKEDYDLICKNPSFQQPYVLLYLLIMPDNVDAYINEIRKSYPNCILVSIPGSTYVKKIGDIECADIGPEEFIGLIKNAEAVFTSSFHGTVFSIIYEKKFASYLPANTGERIRNLLDEFDLADRIVDCSKELKTLPSAIDYSFAQSVREQEKIKASKYFNEILAEVTERDTHED